MPAVASITIVVDDKGAVSALNNVTGAAEKMSPAFAKIGSKGNQIFTQMVKQHERARDSVQLLANVTGVQVPRALEKVLAKSTLIEPLLGAAFNVSVVAAFAAAAVDAAARFGEFISRIRDAGQDMNALEESVTKTSRLMQGPQTFVEMAAQVNATEKRIGELRKQLGLTGELLPGLIAPVRRFGEQFEYSYLELQRLEKSLPGLQDQLDALADVAKRTAPVEILKLQNQARLAGLLGIAQINEAERGETQVVRAEVAARMKTQAAGEAEIVSIHAQAAAKTIALERSITDATRDLQNQAMTSRLTGIDLIDEKEREAVEKQRLQATRDVSFRQGLEDRITAIRQDAENQRIKIVHDAALQGQQAILQAEAAGLAGQAQLDAQRLAELQSISMKEQELHIELTEERLASDRQYNSKSVELARQRAEELKQIETETAIAMLPPRQQADAQIVADAQKRIDDIRALEAKDGTFRIQGEREVGLIMQKEWHDRVENMAGQLESLFDDITSGNIGKRFLDQFKHLVFQMIASWMLGLNQMRSASQGAMGGGGGGILGALFGSLLGINFGGGGGVPGVTDPGFGIPIPGIAGLGGGGGSSASSGGGGLLSGLFGGLFGGSSSSSSAAAGLASLPTALTSSQAGALNLLGGMPLSAGGGFSSAILPAGASAAIGGGKGFSGMLSRMGGLGGVFGLLAMGGMSLLGTNNRALQGLGGFLTGGVIGSLVAMSSIGASLGALGAFLGPIGAVAGLVIGLLLKGSTKKARLKIEADIKAQAQKIEDSYNAHQLDYDPAVSQLEQLRQQGVDALRQAGVKDISRSRVGHVDHWIDKAENEMKATEAERTRRMAIAFGPAQFRAGGFVSPNLAQGYPALFGASAMHFAGGGAVPAILHAGEFVFRPEAVRQHGVAKLARMNAGDGGGGTTINIQAWDAKDVERWLRNGGSALISRAQQRDDLEGRF